MFITGLNRPKNENENDDKIQLCLKTYILFQMVIYYAR